MAFSPNQSAEEPHPGIVDVETFEALQAALRMYGQENLSADKIAIILHHRYPNADYAVVDDLISEVKLPNLRSQMEQQHIKTE